MTYVSSFYHAFSGAQKVPGAPAPSMPGTPQARAQSRPPAPSLLPSLHVPVQGSGQPGSGLVVVVSCVSEEVVFASSLTLLSLTVFQY